MLKAFNFIVIRPLKLHIIMNSSFPTLLDCGSDIMWRHYEIIIAEFFTEPTREPTGNRKVERIHSVNFFNRRFKKSVKKLPKTDRSLSVLSESDDSKWMVHASQRKAPTHWAVWQLQSSRWAVKTLSFSRVQSVSSPDYSKTQNKREANNHISIGEGVWSCVSLFVTRWCGSWTIFHVPKRNVSFVCIYVFICHSFHINSWNIIQP